MKAPTIDAATAAKLAAVLNSPAATQALMTREADRAEQRRSIIAAMLAAESAPIQEAEKHRRAEADLQPLIAKAQQELQALATQAREASYAGQLAQARAERLRNEASAALESLGGSAIAEALAEVRLAERQSLGLIEFRPVLHLYGRRGPGAREVEPAHRQRAERMATLGAALERLVFDAEVTPAEIERQCAAAVAEVRDTVPETLKRGHMVVAG